ncbi:MAG TPA: NTP transferase domain-containing protein [Mycobacteriales bacterium]|nr:NTP transferase domain-containing protein [Mycobacteriales bacterium]
MERFDAIIVAGGEGRRLGGTDKAELVVARGRLLDIVVEACAAAERTIIVGPRRETARPVIWTIEEPPGGGPCAALAAGLAEVAAPTVVLLAVDLPNLTADLVASLASSAPTVAVDAGGREQWLLSSWPVASLVGIPSSGSLRDALGPLPHGTLEVGDGARDVDTPSDLAHAASEISTTPSQTRAE